MSYFRRREARPITAPQTEGSQDKQPFFAPKDANQNSSNGQSAFLQEGGKAAQNGEGERNVSSLGNGTMQAKEVTPIQSVFKSKEPVEGKQKRHLPDSSPVAIHSASEDSIASTMNHVSSVTQSGAVTGNNFGITRSDVTITNQTVTSVGTTHTLTADVVHTITWQVRAALGPSNQKDISSENDNDITAANYTAVADDLTPNASGRPPRSSFWAKDLTEQHERYHAYDQRKDSFGPSVVSVIQAWLNAQTVANASEINDTLMKKARNQGVIHYNSLVNLPSTENDAYSDGKAAYQARADAIRTKGANGGY